MIHPLCCRLSTLILALMLLTGVVVAQPGPNLLANAIFADTQGSGVPDGWMLRPGGNATSTWLTLEKVENDNVLNIIDRDPAVGVGLGQQVNCQPGHQYAFSAETRGGSVWLFLNFFDAVGKMIAPEHSVTLPHRDVWQRGTFRATAPAGAARVLAWIYTTSTTVTEVKVRKPELHDEGEPVTLTGPLTSDKEYFAALNLDLPGLETVKAAVARGDYPAAAAAYLAYRRTKSPVRWRIDPVAKPAAAVATQHAAADRVLQHLIAMPWGNDLRSFPVGEKIDWTYNPLPPTDPAFTKEWTYIALNRNYMWNDLADAYWKTLDEKYAREWVAELESWVHDNLVPLEAGFGDTLTWRTIEAGIRMSEVWPDAYYHFLNSPSFTPRAHLDYAISALEHAQRLQRILHDYPDHGGNWVTMECNGLCTAGVLFPEWKSSVAFISDAFTRMDKELTAQVYPDGGQIELSTAYHQVSMVNFMGLVTIAKMNATPIPVDYLAKLKAMYLWDLRMMDQSGLMPPLNDGAEVTRVTHVLADAQRIWGDAEFAFGATLGKEGTAPPASSFLPYSGYAVMRSGWKADDLYLLFDAGPVGMGHWHEDMLTLYLSAFRRPLLTEAGGFAYDQSPMRKYVLGTTAHNTITVDGKEQHRGTGAVPPMTPVSSRWNTSPVYDYACGTYDAGYQTTEYIRTIYQPVRFTGPRDTSITHTRHVFFLKPYYAVAIDLLTGTGNHRYDAYFHLDAPDAAVDDASKAVFTTRTDGVQLGLIPLLTDGLQVRKVVGQQDPPLGWVAWPHRPIPTIIYTRQGPAPAVFATLLYPYRGERPAVSTAAIGSTGAAWAGKVDTPTERAIMTIKMPGAPQLELAPDGLQPLSTDAGAVVVRLPKGQPAFRQLGIEGATRLHWGATALTTTAPASLTLEFTENGPIRCFNAGTKAVTASFTGPVARTVDLPAGAWVEINEQAATPK